MIHLTDEGRKALEEAVRWLENQTYKVPTFDISVGISKTPGWGTACYIAGFIALRRFKGAEDMSWKGVRELAGKVLTGKWEYELEESRYCELEDLLNLWYPWVQFPNADYESPKVAAATIRHLLDTGEVNWGI